jgi:hypothetical protein
MPHSPTHRSWSHNPNQGLNNVVVLLPHDSTWVQHTLFSEDEEHLDVFKDGARYNLAVSLCVVYQSVCVK